MDTMLATGPGAWLSYVDLPPGLPEAPFQYSLRAEHGVSIQYLENAVAK